MDEYPTFEVVGDCDGLPDEFFSALAALLVSVREADERAAHEGEEVRS